MPPPGLPTGTLTCVFTDIEGSTRMLRELGAAYDAVLALHDATLREVWRAHHGHEVKTLGDAFLVVFERAADAVAAGVAAQRALAAAPWPTPRPVRVRIGMHTGYARASDGDYRALVVNQAARIVGAARGGQVLLTDETATAAAGAPGLTLRPLGHFRVRDFDHPVGLLAATGPGVAPVDVPPRVRPADGHNLVRPTTSLVGREEDVAALGRLVEPGRVTTVVGPGGVGKTRLATEAALAAAGGWEDGAWFVDLAPLGEGALVPEAIGDAVGAPAAPAAERWPEVLAYLGERRLLVVLDNCEHLTEASARAAAALVADCPDLAVLATSRRPLGLRGERVHRLAPLGTDARAAGPAPAVELFLDRRGSGDRSDLETVTALCAELDGLPLAIELAAARSASVPPTEILRRLRRTPEALRSEDPTLPARQRSLGRLLDWGWDLLEPDARTVLGRLSVFAGGFDVDAAEVVGAGGDIGADDVAGLVWTLIDASLVRPEEAAGATRYRLLSTVRAHARGRTSAEELAAANRRLAGLLLDRVGPARAMGRGWAVDMELELDNVRAAAAAVDDPAAAQALGWSIGRHHDMTDRFAAGVAEIERLLDARPEPTPERVGLLTLLADLHLRTTSLDRVEAALAEAEALAATVGCPAWDDAGTTRTRGVLALRRGEPALARDIARRALAGDHSERGRARLHDLVGCASAALGDLRGSADGFEAELRCATTAGLETFLTTIHSNLAETYLQLGDEGGAARHQRVALARAREEGQPVIVAFGLMVAARLVAARGRPHDAVVLQTKADTLLDAADYALYETDAAIRSALLADACAEIGQDAHAEAVATGRTLPVDAAADLAEEILASVGSPTNHEAEAVT